jgi:hypothetical protein
MCMLKISYKVHVFCGLNDHVLDHLFWLVGSIVIKRFVMFWLFFWVKFRLVMFWFEIVVSF